MRRFDLVAFDVDGTLVVHEQGQTVWEVLNRRFTGDDGWNPQRYQEYLDGKLSYADWVAQDIEGWKAGGATRESLIAAFSPLRLVDGTREALTRLREEGMRTVVISGTLDLLLHTLLPDPPLDEIYCNHIAFDAEGRIAHWEGDLPARGVHAGGDPARTLRVRGGQQQRRVDRAHRRLCRGLQLEHPGAGGGLSGRGALARPARRARSFGDRHQ
jgi:HAD superfamily phosphoserine phosphatase-like hydrolase